MKEPRALSRRVFLAVFENEGDILAAVRGSRERGLEIADVYTPYAVHGMSKAMSLPASRLSWLCFLFGLFGAVSIAYFQFWASAISWPINVGGKPWNSLPAFVPAIFATMVLCAGVGTLIAFIVLARLAPGKNPMPLVPGATDDRFVLALDAGGAGFDPVAVRELLARFGATQVEERTLELPPCR